MSDFSPPPLPPPPEPPASASATPWDERDRLGFFTALVDTTVGVLSSPSRFFVGAPAGIGGPLFYGMILGVLGIWISAMYGLSFALVAGMVPGAGSEAFGKLPSWLQNEWISFLLQVVLGPVFLLLWLFVAAGVTHAALVMVGGAKRGFEATFAVFCYAQAFAIFNVIPMCGGLLGLPYLVVVLVVGLAQVHTITEGRAYSGLVATIALACCCLVVFVMILAGGVAGMLGAMAR